MDPRLEKMNDTSSIYYKDKSQRRGQLVDVYINPYTHEVDFSTIPSNCLVKHFWPFVGSFTSYKKKIYSPKTKKPEGECFICKSEKHWAAECPDRQKTFACYLCQDTSHGVNKCPLYPTTKKSTQTSDSLDSATKTKCNKPLDQPMTMQTSSQSEESLNQSMIDALFAPFEEKSKNCEDKMDIDPPSSKSQNGEDDQIQQPSNIDQSCNRRKKSERKCIFCPDKHRNKMCDSIVLKKTSVKRRKSTSVNKTVKKQKHL